MCQRKKRRNTLVVNLTSIHHPSSIDHQHCWSGQGRASNGPDTTRAPKQHLVCERNVKVHNTLILNTIHTKRQFDFVECKVMKKDSVGFKGLGSCDCNFGHRSVRQCPPGGRPCPLKKLTMQSRLFLIWSPSDQYPSGEKVLASPLF